MQLYLNKASPYARLVLVVAYEKQLNDRVELVWTDPWASEPALLGVTPFAKVPVLIAEDGAPLVESACICDYLDSIGSAPDLMPASGAARVGTLRKCGLGRGLIDVAFGATIQNRYAPAADNVLHTRWSEAVGRAVAVLESMPTSGEPDLGDLTIAVGLSYLDFRMPQTLWRNSAPRLAKWFERVSARESLTKTAP
jgi:glutathione S-transferase